MTETAVRVAVVTGGASGIGAATVERLHSSGWQVATLDVASDQHSLAAATLQVDVRDGPAVAAAFDEVRGRLGGVDAVVHCAAIAQRGESIEELTVEQFRKLVDVDLVGSYAVARVASGVMRSGGAIVLASSGSGIRARPGMAGYGAAKAGVIHLTKLLAVELGPVGIRVNCVSPGVTLTPLMLDSWGAADADTAFAMADTQASIPLGRLVTADEVAAAVCYLVSPDTAAITGHNLVADGGRSL